MKKHFSFTLIFLLLVFCAAAQPKTKVAAKKPAVPESQKLLKATGFPVQMINDSIAVIPFTGKNIEAYDVVVQKVGDLYIVYTNLSEALPGKLDDAKYKYLLQRNDEFDIVKIGLAEDGIFYLRADVYKTTATSAILKRIINQVANVTNIIGGELK